MAEETTRGSDAPSRTTLRVTGEAKLDIVRYPVRNVHISEMLRDKIIIEGRQVRCLFFPVNVL